MDLLLERLSPELGRYVTLGVGIVSTAFLLVVSWAAVELAVSNQVQDSPVLTVPMSVPYLAIPVGLILMALFTLIDTWRILRRTERSGRTDAEEGDDIPGAPVKR